MRGSNDQSRDGTGDAAIWALVRRQHGAVARRQLLELGLTPRRIERRIASGRLHPVWRGVYAVGRPLLGRRGRWMAAVLACGPDAALSHGSAAALWGFGKEQKGLIEVSVPSKRRSRQPGIRVHRAIRSISRPACGRCASRTGRSSTTRCTCEGSCAGRLHALTQRDPLPEPFATECVGKVTTRGVGRAAARRPATPCRCRRPLAALRSSPPRWRRRGPPRRSAASG